MDSKPKSLATAPTARLEAIDVTRGLAALSVAVYHHHFGQVLAHQTGAGWLAAIDWPGASIAVPVFFVVSGFCIHLGWLKRRTNTGFTRTFIIQRFFRIYPPWIVAILLSAFVTSVQGHRPTAEVIVTHITLTNGFFDDYTLNAALWSVSVESCLYVIYPIWLAFRLRYGRFASVGLAIAISATSNAVTAWIVPLPTGVSMWFFLNVWSGWVAGAMLAEYWMLDNGRVLRGPVWWVAGTLVCGAHIYMFTAGLYSGAWSYARLPLLITACTWPVALLLIYGERLIVRFGRPATVTWRALIRLGALSYSLYLLHIPIDSLRFSLTAYVADSRFGKILLFTGWFVLVLGAAWLSYRWVEKPSITLGRNLARRFQQPPQIDASRGLVPEPLAQAPDRSAE